MSDGTRGLTGAVVAPAAPAAPDTAKAADAADAAAPAGPRRWTTDFGWPYAANGFIGFAFAASGPVAVILSAAAVGGLDEAQIASWLFGAFFVNGLLTIAMSIGYRSPLVFFWTIPGTVLVGPALGHLSFAEVVGAFVATGVLMLGLGLSGSAGRLMRALPMPIVMGMVAGVFLKFGTDLVVALSQAWRLALPMTVAFVAASALPALNRRVPALIAAMIVGAFALWFGGEGAAAAAALAPRGPAGTLSGLFAVPILTWPAFSLNAMFELVVPLAITVLFVQNGQGFAVLGAAGHRPPVDAVTIACGGASIVAALVGTVSTCLTGPCNALVTSSGERHRHYAAAAFTGLLGVVFGLLAPLFTRVMLALPPAFIATLAGLAMLRVLQGAFAAAFGQRFSLGALVALLVTVAGLPLAGIGAPFWGIVFGVATSALLERGDFRAPAR